MQLELPTKFRQIITQKTQYSGALDTALSAFSDWLTPNSTEFFSGYTDHGIDHIQSVLNTTEQIISNESWEYLTPEDIYVLTCSILLHDCAMHITREGLWELLNNDLYNGVLLGFNSEEVWLERWNSFIKEVSRFDDFEYNNFFGEYRDIKLPKIGENSLDDNQKIIIGDFLRKYHACLAQVISTYGIPSKNGAIEIFDKSVNSLNQLSGFVARSHNHNLREMVDLLGDDNARSHRNTHPTFLMGLLRISDYLQIKSERTPKILFKTTAFCSPISIKEWKKHLSIISTHDFHPDEELIFIEAFPEDAKTLVGVKRLLSGLQKEMDEYWAVAGQVYSRYPPLNKLAIKYRRVKSNIDNSIQYVEKNHKTYFPEVLSVKADNQKLFPLLIKPLYGDIPQVGLRELLQNSLDATNERYSQQMESSVNELHIPFGIKILIDLDQNKFMLIDNGVGMNVEVIKDYFLKIGSSYRTSEQWKNKFTEEGTSRVPRTGKFGIGMLAGFLIGDRINIRTKHMESNSRTIEFNYTLESDEIELKYIQCEDVGTTIIIDSDTVRLKTLIECFNYYGQKQQKYHSKSKKMSSWWYYFSSPNIEVTIKEAGKESSPKLKNSIDKASLNTEWYSIVDSTLDSFYWRHNSERNYVYCNGIILQNMASPIIKISNNFDHVEFDDLEICIFDNAGKFPLNLTRDALVTERFYEHDKLEREVKSNYINNLKASTTNYQYNKKSIRRTVNLYKPHQWKITFIPIVFDHDDIYPFTSKKHSKQTKYILVDFLFTNQDRGFLYNSNFDEIKSNFSYLSFINAEKKPSTVESAINCFLLNGELENHWYWNKVNKNETIEDFNAWVYVKESDFYKLSENSLNYIKSNNLSIIDRTGWKIITKSKNSDDLPELGENLIKQDTNAFIFTLIDDYQIVDTEFSKLWNNIQE